MNKRQIKKFHKKCGRMHYCDARLAKITQYVCQTYPNTNLIIYETTRRGHIKKIYVAQGSRPSSAGVSIYKKP